MNASRSRMISGNVDHAIVSADYHLRRLRGRTQPHLMYGSDGHLYIVKFQNNPHGVRVLATEFLVAHLARVVGLPVPDVKIVRVDEWVVNATPELTIIVEQRVERCRSGLQSGSQYAAPLGEAQAYDWLPESMLPRVCNLQAFAGMLAFDKWVCNTENRHAVFCRRLRASRYTSMFVDHDCCFGGPGWHFSDAPLGGAYFSKSVYAGVTSWESFEPWLSRIETIERSVIYECERSIPGEWYEENTVALQNLREQLMERRSAVRKLIRDFRNSSWDPFPNWHGAM